MDIITPTTDPNTPIADIYKKVLNLFQSEDRFAQQYFQYNKEGKKCPWRDGYSFCALGALCFFGEGYSNRSQCCLQRVSEHLYGEVIQAVNDSSTGYERVKAALKFAIDLWEGYQPTDEELGRSVTDVLKARNG